MNQWLLTTLNTFSGSTNMAYDEVLLNTVVDGSIDTPILRFYHWIMPTISIGRFQSIQKDIDLVQCKKDHIPVVRRPTGGRAVFHDHELTYALAIPPQHPLAQMNIESTYMRISEAFLSGLQSLHIPAVMEKSSLGTRTYPDKASCFAATTRHEIQINGHKLMGSAQVRHSGGVLQQGSLPMIANQNMSRYFIQSVEAYPGLNEITGKPWDSSTLIPAILEGFQRVFQVTFEDYFPNRQQTALIHSLSKTKYQSDDWNYSR